MAVFSFYLFAIVAVASGLLVVFARNPVHSVLWLILAFFSAAGLFVLLGAEFVAMLMLIVYVGAVAVLFLFVVMMLDVDFAKLREGMATYLPVGLLIGVVLLVQLGFAFGAWETSEVALGQRAAVTPPPLEVENTAALGMLIYTRYVLPVPGGGAGAAGGDDRRDRADAAPPRGRQAPGRADADVPRSRHGGRSARREAGAGDFGMTIGLGHYLTVAAILFVTGIFGIFVNRKNIIVILMSIELMLLAVNINLVAFSAHLGDLVGQVFTLFVLTVAAAEAAIGLAMLVCFFRNAGTIAVDDVNVMKG